MAEQSIPAEYWTAAEVMKGIFETKVCLAKKYSPDPCDGKIIAAHTIPRTQLDKIATDGLVYAVAGTAADLARNDGKLSAKTYGIRTFSVLNCFCAAHDNNIFAHIEDADLVFDPRQLTLLHFRTLASELYRKASAYQSVLYQLEEQEKKRTKHKEALEFLKANAVGHVAGVRDAGTAFDRCATFCREV
jgi:hypothetical protein